MKFKVDENLPEEVSQLLRQNGYDAHSVIQQNLSGHPDENIARVCQSERRTIITLDLDFADIRTYPPENYEGIIVLRPHNQSIPSILQLCTQLIPRLQSEPLIKHLWIAEPDSLRIRPGDP